MPVLRQVSSQSFFRSDLRWPPSGLSPAISRVLRAVFEGDINRYAVRDGWRVLDKYFVRFSIPIGGEGKDILREIISVGWRNLILEIIVRFNGYNWNGFRSLTNAELLLLSHRLISHARNFGNIRHCRVGIIAGRNAVTMPIPPPLPPRKVSEAAVTWKIGLISRRNSVKIMPKSLRPGKLSRQFRLIRRPWRKKNNSSEQRFCFRFPEASLRRKSFTSPASSPLPTAQALFAYIDLIPRRICKLTLDELAIGKSGQFRESRKPPDDSARR